MWDPEISIPEMPMLHGPLTPYTASHAGFNNCLQTRLQPGWVKDEALGSRGKMRKHRCFQKHRQMSFLPGNFQVLPITVNSRIPE